MHANSLLTNPWGHRASLRRLTEHLVCALAAFTTQASAQTPATLVPCRVGGVETMSLCASINRPLNDADPTGKSIDIHFVVLPALAKNKAPDPVFLFAGGPGQSAIRLAGNANVLFARLKSRRDIVLIDQRGVGKSMPLACKGDAKMSLQESSNPAFLPKRMNECRAELRKKHSLLDEHFTHFTTAEASRDVDAVRAALGYKQINAVGGSYGTRAVLDYQRQFPARVRRSILDGVAPPDMVLPATVSPDAQAALDALLVDCEKNAACSARFPQLRAQWQAMVASLPQTVTLMHPATLRPESVTITQDTVAAAVRSPLYSPAVAAALPFAIAEAAQGRFIPLMGLGSVGAGGAGSELAWGMHFSVICAEDFPRLEAATDKPGAEMGGSFEALYRSVCAQWPQAAVPAAFYTLPVANHAVLLLSGGLDPVTPPRHAERVAKALGPKTRHMVAPQVGHGVMAHGCTRDVMYRFINAQSDADALAVPTACIAGAPRPDAYVPPGISAGSKPARSAP